MKPELKYIELKSGYTDDGPAWIGMVEFSKTGRTMYFNDKAFKGNGHGTCYDVETNERYWITGIKKAAPNRHWAGRRILKIMIDRAVVNDHLQIKDVTELDLNSYEIVDIRPTDKRKFVEIENSSASGKASRF